LTQFSQISRIYEVTSTNKWLTEEKARRRKIRGRFKWKP